MLYVLNDFRIKGMPGYVPSDSFTIKMMFHTIEHEFGHILHQTVLYPQDFKRISVGDYTSDWNNTTDEEAQSGARAQQRPPGQMPSLPTRGEHTVPDVVTRSTFKQYRDSTAVTELKQFEGRGHSLTIDGGWREVADAVLAWLREQGI